MVLTLGDINALYPETMDGDLYSDLYKSVNGFRPRGVTFDSIEQFNSMFEFLVEENNEEMDREEKVQKANVEKFEMRILNTMNLMNSRDRKHMIEVIAEAEEAFSHTDEEGKNHLDMSYLEYILNVPYDYIMKEFRE